MDSASGYCHFGVVTSVGTQVEVRDGEEEILVTEASGREPPVLTVPPDNTASRSRRRGSRSLAKRLNCKRAGTPLLVRDVHVTAAQTVEIEAAAAPGRGAKAR